MGSMGGVAVECATASGRVRRALACACLTLAGCASTSTPAPQEEKAERNYNAPSLTIDASSQARQILESIPLESVMERFEAYDAQGRLISYASFTDTDYGGVVFVDGKLLGSLTRRDARAFYVCRGHTAIAPERYWSTQAESWLATLLPRVHPETTVELAFSGKSTVQSIKEASKNPLLGRIRAFIGMGTNPLKVIDTLNTAHSDYEAGEKYDAESRALRLIAPGMNELRLASIASPTDLAFAGGGMVMGYPEHRVEFFVYDGTIRVIQQPSFHMQFRSRPAQFYAAGARWAACTPEKWMEAIPTADTLAPPTAQPSQ